MDYVIIVAGGKGLRMGTETPKQFLPVAGKPILMRTIERFYEYNPDINIILVLPESQQEYWHQLCEEHHFDIKHQIANGGDTRFQSSKNGLALIPDDADGVVGIHDGVRPFVSTSVIARHAGTKAHGFGNTHLALQLGWYNDFATWLDAVSMTYLCHLTIHVDDVCLALDCI